jgi:hypothetical protein
MVNLQKGWTYWYTLLVPMATPLETLRA